MRINDAFVAKIAITRLTKICVAIFALAERLPTSATLLHAVTQHLGYTKAKTNAQLNFVIFVLNETF